MKTLLVTNDFPPRAGGIERYMLTLVVGLEPSEVIVVAPEIRGAKEFDQEVECEIIRLPSLNGRLWPSSSLGRYLIGIVKTRKIDVVAFAAMLPLGVLGPKIARASNVPFIVWHHGAELVGLARMPGLRQLMRSVARKAILQFAVSEWTRQEVIRSFGYASPVHLLRVGVDLDEFNPRIDGSEVRRRTGFEDAQVIVCVGRLVPRKGQDTLIRILPGILRRHPKARLLIVGDGPSRGRLERLAAQNSVMNEVHFSGEVNANELSSYYAAGDIYASPIRTRKFGLEAEGLGVVFLEAAAMGLPVVAGISGGTAEAVKNGKTGILVDGGDDEAVRDGLERLLGDAVLREEMGRAGRLWMESEFDRQKLPQEFRAIMAEVVRQA